jgi:hypothetical protein
MISKKLLIGGLALAMGGGGMGALATEGAALAGSQPATYTACVNHSTGALYHVSTNATPHCFRRDKTITWDQEGPAGAMGAPGADGNAVLNGSGAPASSLGAPGDFYIDTTAHVLYGPKTATGWPRTGTSLVGPPGAPGAAGQGLSFTHSTGGTLADPGTGTYFFVVSFSLTNSSTSPISGLCGPFAKNTSATPEFTSAVNFPGGGSGGNLEISGILNLSSLTPGTPLEFSCGANGAVAAPTVSNVQWWVAPVTTAS